MGFWYYCYERVSACLTRVRAVFTDSSIKSSMFSVAVWLRQGCPLSPNPSPSQRRFKYHRVLFSCDGKMAGDMDRQCGETSTVLQVLCCCCGEEGAEPQGRALNLHTEHLCPDPSGHQLWVVREGTRLWIQVVKIVEMSFSGRWELRATPSCHWKKLTEEVQGCDQDASGTPCSSPLSLISLINHCLSFKEPPFLPFYFLHFCLIPCCALFYAALTDSKWVINISVWCINCRVHKNVVGNVNSNWPSTFTMLTHGVQIDPMNE